MYFLNHYEVYSTLRNDLEFREARVPAYRSDTSILFVHGMAHGANFFDDWMVSLALNDRMRASAVSLEGHGQSKLKRNRKSINDLTISDYKQNILNAIANLAEHFKCIIPVCHSMGARCAYELLYEDRLPKEVKGIALLNPVPDCGILGSALAATMADIPRGRFTPWSFMKALIKGDIQNFMKANPKRTNSLFFSSEPGKRERLAIASPERFCQDFIFPESRAAVIESLFSTDITPGKKNIPLLIVGTENDRLISREDLYKMHRNIEDHGHRAELKFFPDISHESPMDIESETVLDYLREWFGRVRNA